MVAIVNARASTNRVDLAVYIIALHTLIVPFLGKRGFLVSNIIK